MPKRLTTEDHLALLRQLRTAPDAPGTIAALEQLFASPRLHGLVLKSAATLAEQLGAKSLAPSLVAAAQSLLAPDAAKRDPGCEAKIALLNVLLTWEVEATALYVTMAAYRQLEPTFGDPVDSAAEVRGLAALGIATTRPRDAIFLLTDLLCDTEKATRARAATALGLWRGAEALPLLRLKARMGDESPEVTGEVLAAILRHDPRQHLSFVATILEDKNLPVAEAAALALGDSKLPTALASLAAAYPRLRGTPILSTLLMAISLLRTAEATDWLLAQLPTARPAEALLLLDALHLHAHDEKLLAQLNLLVKQHPALRNPFTEVFHER